MIWLFSRPDVMAYCGILRPDFGQIGEIVVFILGTLGSSSKFLV